MSYLRRKYGPYRYVGNDRNGLKHGQLGRVVDMWGRHPWFEWVNDQAKLVSSSLPVNLSDIVKADADWDLVLQHPR